MYLRNFRFSTRFFSPRRLICTKSVITSSGYNHSVPDRLYFSCRIRGASETNTLRQFGKMLGAFPFSKLALRGPVLRVYAVELAEPSILEREFPVSSDTAGTVADIIEGAGEFMQ